MVAQMDAEGFGSCTNHGECEAVCPKEISVEFIARAEPRLHQGQPRWASRKAEQGRRGLTRVP